MFDGDGSGARGDLQRGRPRHPARPEARGDVKTEPSYGRLRHPAQFIANILRAFNARSRGRHAPERRLPESAEQSAWAWTCSGRRRSSATSRRSTACPAAAACAVRSSASSRPRRRSAAPTSSTRWCSRSINVEHQRAERHVARSLAAAGAGRQPGRRWSTRSNDAAAARHDVERDARAASSAPSPRWPRPTRSSGRAPRSIWWLTSSQYQVER